MAEKKDASSAAQFRAMEEKLKTKKPSGKKPADSLVTSNKKGTQYPIYQIDKDGLLSLTGHSDCGGDWPRNFVIDPSGNYLLAGNQRSSDIAVFKIDPKTGIPSKEVNDIKIGSPACLKFK